MTNSTRARCAWCGERFLVPRGPGRPPRYCRRSHRQRAYESRRLAVDRGLEADEVLLTESAWAGLRDAVFVAEAAARDAETDLRDHPTKAELVEIVVDLVRAIDGVVGATAEPKAIGSDLGDR